MPKKTKKEKIIAAYRKRLQLLQSQQIPLNTYSTEKHIPAPSRRELSFIREQKIEQPTAIKQKTAAPTVEDGKIVWYFKQDLRRSLILIIIIIGLEISLYFVRIIK